MMKRNLQLWLSYIVILLPMGYGIVNYTALPAKMAIHFNLDNQPMGWPPNHWWSLDFQ